MRGQIRNLSSKRISTFLSPVTQQAQKHQEQIDKIKVKLKGSHNGAFTDNRLAAVHNALRAHAADLLDIIGGQAGKNDHPDPGNYPGHH